MNIRRILREEILREASRDKTFANNIMTQMNTNRGLNHNAGINQPQYEYPQQQPSNNPMPQYAQQQPQAPSLQQLQQLMNAGQYQQAYQMLPNVTARSMKERYALQTLGNQLTNMYRSGQMNQQKMAQQEPVQQPVQPQTYQQAPMYQNNMQPAQMPQPQAQPMQQAYQQPVQNYGMPMNSGMM